MTENNKNTIYFIGFDGRNCDSCYVNLDDYIFVDQIAFENPEEGAHETVSADWMTDHKHDSGEIGVFVLLKEENLVKYYKKMNLFRPDNRKIFSNVPPISEECKEALREYEYTINSKWYIDCINGLSVTDRNNGYIIPFSDAHYSYKDDIVAILNKRYAEKWSDNNVTFEFNVKWFSNSMLKDGQKYGYRLCLTIQKTIDVKFKELITKLFNNKS